MRPQIRGAFGPGGGGGLWAGGWAVCYPALGLGAEYGGTSLIPCPITLHIFSHVKESKKE